MKKENADINQYYKQIDSVDSNGKPYKHTLFDYDKIWESEIPIFLIISERGSKGKTTQAKRLARSNFAKGRGKTI